jgi:hypothetical protein
VVFGGRRTAVGGLILISSGVGSSESAGSASRRAGLAPAGLVRPGQGGAPCRTNDGAEPPAAGGSSPGVLGPEALPAGGTVCAARNPAATSDVVAVARLWRWLEHVGRTGVRVAYRADAGLPRVNRGL